MQMHIYNKIVESAIAAGANRHEALGLAIAAVHRAERRVELRAAQARRRAQRGRRVTKVRHKPPVPPAPLPHRCQCRLARRTIASSDDGGDHASN
jgi:hypothetical protein